MFYRNALKGLRGSDRVYSVKSFGGGMNTVSEVFFWNRVLPKSATIFRERRAR